MDKLTELAGVGRKTANVVRGEVWGLADGITVDTHVKRITRQLLYHYSSTMFLTFFHYCIVVISFKNSNFVRI